MNSIDSESTRARLSRLRELYDRRSLRCRNRRRGYLVGTDTPPTQERALLRTLAEEFGDGPTTANPDDDEG